ncbi:BMP-binding endothelial regulator protein-like [Stegodyphus dumicola]|uniref:BMP-binding endothelial regulator protein-like n=1 Tax=Stegodyphus dumicola TaxID=202533 RepID=UPI0015AA02EC|nr:BMP-binding endothelial regulator protein-like [Stegodyphus dumicola]
MTKLAIFVLLTLTTLSGTYGSGLNGGSPVYCEKEGVEVEVPWISTDPCISCKCQANKQVKCDREICPNRKYCYLVLFGQEKKSCCDMCKGCNYKGKNYENEEEWTDEEDPCKKLSCQGGVVTETKVQCFASCRNRKSIATRTRKLLPDMSSAITRAFYYQRKKQNGPQAEELLIHLFRGCQETFFIYITEERLPPPDFYHIVYSPDRSPNLPVSNLSDIKLP